MRSCPSCAAPLDDEGICTACGALARGFFRGLDLGAPQIAEAVAHGLDFYLLLGVAPDADVRAVARRYRQLRVLFPDDASGLAPEPARRLALLERAGRVLTDPRLRRTYDELRSSAGAQVTTEVLRCAGCAAPLPPGAARCAFCGTPRPPEAQPPAAPPESGPPATEPVDYYALLGLTADHLFSTPPPAPIGLGGPLLSSAAAFEVRRLTGSTSPGPQGGLPSPDDVDAAALVREREILLSPSYTPAEREARVEELEIARRILHDDRRRSLYDSLLLDFRKGLFDHGRLDSLRHLQDQARAEVAEQRGDQPTPELGAALLKQGIGYLRAGLPREAIEPLRGAVSALPGSPEAHDAYVRAILSSDDLLALGGHALRRALASLEALAKLGKSEQRHVALAELCQGLLARDAGDPRDAEAALQRAVALDARLAPAWRGLAALALARGAAEEALAHCGRALALDPRDERALTMAVGACLRSGRRGEAREFAAQIAAIRGAGWTADAVLREVGG